MTDQQDGKLERLFVAVPLPPATRDLLISLQPPAGDGIRLTAPENVHLTLHFLGQANAKLVVPALGLVAAKAFTAKLGAPGHFRLPQRKKVLWVGVEPAPPLLELHARVGAALETVGFEPERRPYVPHLTVARLAPKVPRRVVEAFERARLPADALEFDCKSFALYSSETAPEGARYRVIESYRLG